MLPYLKPLHTIGKVSVNASILYKNQEICNKTNLWKFQLISFFYEKTVKMHSAFLYSFYGRSFRLARQKLIIGSYFTNYSKTITHQTEIFQGKLSTIVIFIPCKLCVNLEHFSFSVLPMLSRGFNKGTTIISHACTGMWKYTPLRNSVFPKGLATSQILMQLHKHVN